MLKQLLINIFLKRRHFWRFASFSEVGDLYLVRLMRTVAIYTGVTFMSVYMLRSGYSILAISLFWTSYYAFKVLVILPLSQLIASIGPKKAIIYSNVLYIPSMIAFVFLGQIGIWALIATGILQAVSAALYDVAYNISFSRVKNSEKAGRQVATMNIAEKLAKGVSPLIGGLIAMFFDPRASIIVSGIFFLLATWPMLYVKETMTTGFKLGLKKFPWKQARASLLAQVPMGLDHYASGGAWTMFLATLIFTSTTNQIYAEIGALTSLILVVSIASTHAYGKLIDKKAGGQLLFWTAASNVVVNIFRALVRTPAMAVGTNAAKEVVMTGYSMAFMRGMFDEADRSGFRVLYIGLSNVLLNIGCGIAAVLLGLAVHLFDTTTGFTVYYFVIAAAAGLILLTKFRLYRQN